MEVADNPVCMQTEVPRIPAADARSAKGEPVVRIGVLVTSAGRGRDIENTAERSAERASANAADLIEDAPREFSLLPVADDLVARTFISPEQRKIQQLGPIVCKVGPFWTIAGDSSDVDAAAGLALFELISRLRNTPASECPEVLIIIPADGGFDPRLIPILASPIVRGEADLAVGSRQTRGSLSPDLEPHLLGRDAVARLFFRAITEKRFTDFSPYRAVRFSLLDTLLPRTPHSSWAFEMQWRAIRLGMRIREVDISYRPPTPISPSHLGFACNYTLGAFSALKTLATARSTKV